MIFDLDLPLKTLSKNVLYDPKVQMCQIWYFGPACHDAPKRL